MHKQATSAAVNLVARAKDPAAAASRRVIRLRGASWCPLVAAVSPVSRRTRAGASPSRCASRST